MHQRANSVNVLELHGSLWRMRCETEKKVFDDFQSGTYKSRKCTCGGWLRPDPDENGKKKNAMVNL